VADVDATAGPAAPSAAGPIAVALAVMVVWGATPVATKLATRDLAPLAVGVLRTVLAGLLAAPFLLATRQHPPAGRHPRRLLAVSGIAGFVAFPILFTVGQQHTSAMHGGMILAALPILTGSYVAILERRRPPGIWLAGCAVALVGEVGIVVLRAGGESSGASVGGDLLVALSALVVSAGYVAGARLGEGGYRSVATTFWGVVLGAALVAPVGLAMLASRGAPSAGAGAWGALLWLAVITTIVGYVGWYWALAHGGIARISTFQFFQPFSGLVLAAVLLGETFTLPLALSSLAILLGVTIAQRSR
jgi:drug/metabolite transporter (DMT)-like permease